MQIKALLLSRDYHVWRNCRRAVFSIQLNGMDANLVAFFLTCLDICLFVVHGWPTILLSTRP